MPGHARGGRNPVTRGEGHKCPQRNAMAASPPCLPARKPEDGAARQRRQEDDVMPWTCDSRERPATRDSGVWHPSAQQKQKSLVRFQPVQPAQKGGITVHQSAKKGGCGLYVDEGELIARLRAAAPIDMDEECQEEETTNETEYGPATSSYRCLVFLRLDLLPYYTSGFE